MAYYLITHHSKNYGFQKIKKSGEQFMYYGLEGFRVEEFENFSEAKNTAIGRAIYRRDCLKDDIRDLRALRKKDVDKH